MTLDNVVHEMQKMLGRQLTLLEFRIARFSYYTGLAKGVSIASEFEELEGENEKV